MATQRIPENSPFRLPQLPRPHREPTGLGTIVKLAAVPGVTLRTKLRFLPFTFQAGPIDTLPINRSYPQTVWDSIDRKQQSRPGVTQLVTINFRTVFTDFKWDWTMLHGDGYVPNPLDMLYRLEQLGEDGAYFRLTIRNPAWRSQYDVNMVAALTSLNSEEVPGEIDARYATVEFTQHRTGENEVKTDRQGGGSRNSKLPTTLQCNRLPASRNTMYELAAFYYGAQTGWRLIAKANSITRDPDYDLRQLGSRKITIPKQP